MDNDDKEGSLGSVGAALTGFAEMAPSLLAPCLLGLLLSYPLPLESLDCLSIPYYTPYIIYTIPPIRCLLRWSYPTILVLIIHFGPILS